MLNKEVWGCEKGFDCVAWLLINIARLGVKVSVGLEKLFSDSDKKGLQVPSLQ